MHTTLSHGERPHVTHVIHIADVHIRVGDHKASRAEEYKFVLQQLCEELKKLPCVQNNTALLVIAGDVFHNKGRLDSVMGTIFFDWINRILDTLPTLVICGNHDFRQENPAFTDMIEWFTTPYMTTSRKHPIHYLQSTGQYLWENLSFGLVSVKETLRAANTSGIVDELPAFPAPLQLSGVTCTIALFHGTVTKSRLPSGRTVEDTLTYPLEWFEGYDIAMLGDIHKQQIDSYKGMQWGYPGSLIQQDFGETTDGHGYILWDIASKTGHMHSIYNPYAAITISNTNNGYRVYFTPKDSVPLKDAIDSPIMPKQPKVRLLGSYADEVTISNTLQAFGIQPSYIKCTQSVQFYKEDNATNTQDVTPLADLNSTDAWKEYLGSSLDCDEWIDAPAKMMVPTSELPPEIAQAITTRNTKIQSYIDVYDAERQRIVTKHHSVHLKYMEWQYLMCYGKLNYFDFERVEGKIALLNGQNASGKSAFMDIICIALYGEPTLSRREFTGNLLTAKIIHDDRPPSESAYVSLTFTVDESQYEVYRTFTQQQDSQNENDLIQQKVVAVYRIDGGEKHVIAEGVVMVNQWIFQHIGSSEEIMMSSMLCQNDNANFFYQKPADQKLILEKALHIENIRAFENILEEASKAHKYILEKVVCYHKGLSDDSISSIDEQKLLKERASLEQTLQGIEPEVERLTNETNNLLSKVGDTTDLVLCENPHEQIDAVKKELSALRITSDEEQIMVKKGQLQERKAQLLESYVEGPYSDSFNDYRNALTTLDKHIAKHQKQQPKVRPELTPEIIAQTQKDYEEWASRVKDIQHVDVEAIVHELESMEITKPEKYVSKKATVGTYLDVKEIKDARAAYIKLLQEWAVLSEQEPERGIPLEDCQNTIQAYEKWQSLQQKEWLQSTTAVVEEKRESFKRAVESSKALIQELQNYQIERVKHPNASILADLQQAIAELNALDAEIQEMVKNPVSFSRPTNDPVALEAWRKRLSEWHAFTETVFEESASVLQERVETVSKFNTYVQRFQDINSEIQEIQKIEFNPECFACCKQPKYIRLQQLLEEHKEVKKALVGAKRKLGLVGKACNLQLQDVEELKTTLEIRKEYESRVESMEHEIREWEHSEALAKKADELSKILESKKAQRTVLAASIWKTWDSKMKHTTAALNKLTESLAKADAFLREREMMQPQYERAKADIEKARQYQEWSKKKTKLRTQIDTHASSLWSMYSVTLKHYQQAVLQQKQYAQEAADWERRMAMIRDQRVLVDKWVAWESKATDLKTQREKTSWICQWLEFLEEEKVLEKEYSIYTKTIQLKNQLDIYERSALYMEWKTLTQQKEDLLRHQQDAIESLARIHATLERISGKSAQLKAIKACLDDLTQRHDRLAELKKRFIGEKQDGFKAFIYKNRVAPLIETEVNAFIANIDQFRLRIKVKNNRFIYLLDDRGNLPTLDHASGYQKFIVGLGMRIALSRIGAVGQNLKHIFLDEGFVAMDSDNLQKTHELLRDIMAAGGYKSMILMSHLDTIRDAADACIHVVRASGTRSSMLRIGERRMPIKKSARSSIAVLTGEQPKKRGRPRKVTA